jgi:hypothetical protein
MANGSNNEMKIKIIAEYVLKMVLNKYIDISPRGRDRWLGRVRSLIHDMEKLMC